MTKHHLRTVDEKFGDIQAEVDAAHEHLLAVKRLADRYALDLRILLPIRNAVNYTRDARILVGISRADVIHMIESEG